MTGVLEAAQGAGPGPRGGPRETGSASCCLRGSRRVEQQGLGQDRARRPGSGCLPFQPGGFQSGSSSREAGRGPLRGLSLSSCRGSGLGGPSSGPSPARNAPRAQGAPRPPAAGTGPGWLGPSFRQQVHVAVALTVKPRSLRGVCGFSPQLLSLSYPTLWCPGPTQPPFMALGFRCADLSGGAPGGHGQPGPCLVGTSRSTEQVLVQQDLERPGDRRAHRCEQWP